MDGFLLRAESKKIKSAQPCAVCVNGQRQAGGSFTADPSDFTLFVVRRGAEQAKTGFFQLQIILLAAKVQFDFLESPVVIETVPDFPGVDTLKNHIITFYQVHIKGFLCQRQIGD